jgi:hypothetical protein
LIPVNFRPQSRPTQYLEENLHLDYNHLESVTCFCGARKAIGDLLCRACLAKLPPAEYAELLGMKPGSGLCMAAAIARREMQSREREQSRQPPKFRRWLK